MTSSGVLRQTVLACLILSVAVAVIASASGHLDLGLGMAAGLMLGEVLAQSAARQFALQGADLLEHVRGFLLIAAVGLAVREEEGRAVAGDPRPEPEVVLQVPPERDPEELPRLAPALETPDEEVLLRRPHVLDVDTIHLRDLGDEEVERGTVGQLDDEVVDRSTAAPLTLP